MQRGQPLGRLVAPVGQDGAAQAGGEGGVAGEVPGVQQAELHLEVVGRGLAGLGRGADRMVEGQAEVPHRVPEAVGERADGLLGVVQQQQVEVAARGELAAAVAADGDQGVAACAGGGRGRVGEAGQPAVGEGGERGAARRPGPRLLVRRRSRAAA